ncbi:hypothetical protein [Vibrio sp. HN007]|uniref:hypothetical protein n=1 Tax=Vibrio iocasae TaxID=3098914 RepID=UPI0035D3EDA9
MSNSISNVLFRSYGTHALKEITLAEGRLRLVVAPWTDLSDEAIAEFTNVEIEYIEAERDSQDTFLDFNLPWDIIRFDSKPIDDSFFDFGLCCSDVRLGFKASWPKITFNKTE